MTNQRRGQETKEAILENACKVFAEKGYRDATHAEICRCAGTNVASINYYFGSKENLYREVFDHLNRRMGTLYPLDGGLSPSTPPEARLRAYIQAHLRRMFDPENLGGLHQIRMSEMFDSTGLLEKALARQLAENRKIIQEILREILGPHASQRELDWCEMSVVGQCFTALPGHGDRGPRKIFGLEAGLIDALVEHITAFSLAGIKAIYRKQKGSSEKEKKQGVM